MVHEAPEQIARLVEALEEGGRHQFVIHVDDKPASEPTQRALLAYASTNRPPKEVVLRPRPATKGRTVARPSHARPPQAQTRRGATRATTT